LAALFLCGESAEKVPSHKHNRLEAAPLAKVGGAVAERGEVEKMRAKTAQKLGTEMIALCKQIDTHGRDFFLSFIQLRNVMLELSRLGPGVVPSVAMFDAVCKRAYAAMAMGSPLQLLHLAPMERHSFIELGERWGKSIEGWAAQRLDEDKERAA
jgi:hypothetical protein